ncbi:serine hydrolase domain-containing protein [Aliiglaciecola litoralis]|uniref:Beta-lactamase-related domain-containing protein n=1 Tax=Aliiglaciecola litoralis TaxID=582857 RepID=A0ABP3WR66_9ALTE
MKSFNYFVLVSSLLVFNLAAFANENASVDYDGFGQKVDALRKSKHIPGLSIAVVDDAQLMWSAGYGFADNNNEIPVTANTPFWIASVTKTFVGLAYLHLAKDGIVNLDELAAKTPEFTGLCDWLAGTTIPFSKGMDCNEPITIRHVLHHQINKPVGTTFMYNPIMYSRLSRHLEHGVGEGVRQVEGRHNYLAQAIDKYILQPADMTRSLASMWDRSKPLVYFDLADGFKVDERGNKDRNRRPERHIAGGAGVVSTVLDLAKYDIAISNGKIASGDIGKALLQPATFNDGSQAPYGFGWYFQCYNGEKLMWHSGWDPDNGYSAIHLRLPERNMALIMLANGEELWWDNPLDKAQIESSEFVQLFFNHFNLTKGDACGSALNNKG